MTLSAIDRAILDAHLAALDDAVKAARWASDLDACKAALGSAWSANTRARITINEIEQRTREGALAKLEDA